MNFLHDMYRFGLARRLDGHLSQQPMGAFLDVHPRKDPVLVPHPGHAMLPHPVVRTGPRAFERPNLLHDSWANVIERPHGAKCFWDQAEAAVAAAGDKALLAGVRHARKRLQSGLAQQLQQSITEPPRYSVVVRAAGDDAAAVGRPAMEAHLKAEYAERLRPDPDSPRICMVTGLPASIPGSYGFVRRMPGADSRGSGFLTWNDATTCYLGREGSDNFPVGTGTWDTIQCAINYASFDTGHGVSRCVASFGKEGPTDGVMWICEQDDLDFLRVLMHRKFLHTLAAPEDWTSRQKWEAADGLTAAAWEAVERSTESPPQVALYGVSAHRTRAGLTDHVLTTVGAVCKSLLSFRKAFEGDGSFSVGDAVFRFHERWRDAKDDGKAAIGEPMIGGRDMVSLALVALAGRPFPEQLRGRMEGAVFRRNPAPYHFAVQTGWAAVANR